MAFEDARDITGNRRNRFAHPRLGHGWNVLRADSASPRDTPFGSRETRLKGVEFRARDVDNGELPLFSIPSG